MRNFGVPGAALEGVPLYEDLGVAASRAEEREKDVFTKNEKWLLCLHLTLRSGRSPDKKRFF